MVIDHVNRTHAAACSAAEGNRQNALAQAVLTGGGSAAVAAAQLASDIAFYRSVIASCKANNLPYGQFVETLQRLGTGGA
ncbi:MULTISPECIES: hypothetical protein [unclassified Bradyrhizobium]|uniref:hypothetical protein n=1 Tax=unclassified Bradyrhizobium TaxID=2631580 RepID=UPI001FF73713|nr:MULTISPECIES: hypothetical protein [unclassified Bradyrhizobium]MCK1707627.1 hypothetical protein [Bradyrhizobium sp. 143]MCK1724838.1 hypothetical protein [Bradyrhizobium sp. 142]